MTPQDCATHVLARPDQDAVAALEALADEIRRAARRTDRGGRAQSRASPAAPSNRKPSEMTLAALLPENAIVADDSVTSGRADLSGHVQRGSP